jgi:hypothetical protein
MPALAKPDIIYIGYPKSASTFVGRFLDGHPDVTTERYFLSSMLRAHSAGDSEVSLLEKPNPDKVHVSIDEKVAESICMVRDEENWYRYRFVPNSWDKISHDIILDPFEAALRLKKALPSAKVLLVIRDQVDWLHSAYKYFMPRLPANRRTFADFCATPRGIAYLQAGYFDQTISAYADAFGSARVCVLRFEDITKAPQCFAEELCAFLNITTRPLPREPQNESSLQVARMRKLFPIVDRLPASIRAAAKPYARLLPIVRQTMLSDSEILLLRSLYAVSNQKTERLLSQLGADRPLARGAKAPD